MSEVAASIVLALNFGSSSLKAASYLVTSDVAGENSDPRETGRTSVATENEKRLAPGFDADRLLDRALEQLASLSAPPAVVAHRIVHGGDRPGPAELTADTLAELQVLSALAPVHQPPALELIRAARKRWPSARQIGVFDTSWHQSIPETHRLFPLPYTLFERGVKRYGFHGIAFQSAVRQLTTLAPEVARGRLVLAHLGGGSSLSAVLGGRCVNTTMGMTPLAGVPMSTRPGSLDPGVLLHLQRALGLSPDEIDRMLWHESGMKGLSGETGDMRALLASGSQGAQRAIDVYVARVAQEIAAMAACIRGIDGLVFTGGIGAHAAGIRSRLATELDWLGVKVEPGLNRADAREITSPEAPVRVFALKVDEELELALAAASMVE